MRGGWLLSWGMMGMGKEKWVGRRGGEGEREREGGRERDRQTPSSPHLPSQLLSDIQESRLWTLLFSP